MNNNAVRSVSQSRTASIASIASSETSETPSVSDEAGTNNNSQSGSRKVILYHHIK